MLASASRAQQYYMRGEVKDEAGNILQNVTIMQVRTGYIFRSGSLGTFGIGSNHSVDSFLFTQQGYYTERIALYADNFNNIKMRLLPASASNLHRDKLSSLTKDLDKEEQKTWYSGDETYASLLENHFIDARKFPTTGMSLNVDRASYSNIRRFINLNSQVPPDAVRVEEMLNYFNLDYMEPAGSALFHCRTTLSNCPWNPANQLFYVNLFSRKLNLDSLPPSNLVFLIDVSGSMDMPNRLPLLKSAFRLLVNNLREKDSVSIVVYGGVTGTMLNCTSGAEKEKILKVLDELEPGGSTPGESGIKMAYAVARRHFIKDGNNRVILATDGDFNVGLKTEDELDELISKEKESGIYLTCLGVGMGNYKDSKIQTLANKGNGNFAYLDTYQEAEKVLMKEFTQTLYAVANEVYMNVEFSPDYVKQYRLIGFDNKVGALRDSMSIVEGGEIGSGFSLVALFEIVPTERNRAEIKANKSGDKFCEILLDYQKPDNDKQDFHDHYTGRFEYTQPQQLAKNYQFYSAVALFGSMLRNSEFVKEASWNDVMELAQASLGTNDLLQKEFINLVGQAKNLYSKGRKRKSSH